MAEFVLNGSPAKAGDDHPHLLSALRDELGVTSPKDGCSPTGQCGCCTVLIDGKARVACQISMDKVEGTAITTVEGLDPVERDRYASAFAASGALQCGFCTPGIVMRTKSLIDKKGSSLTREEASRHLGGNLCRCTGYTKILDAVEALASGDIPVMVTPGGVGSRGVKYESCQLAIGMRPYIDDMNPDGCLHAALHFSEHARADIVAIDATAALAVAGVHAVLHRRRHPRRAARRHHPHRLAGDDPGRRSDVVSRRRARHRRRRHQGDREGGGRRGPRRVHGPPADDRPGDGHAQRRASRVAARRQRAVQVRLPAWRRRRRARGSRPTWSTRRSRPSASSTPSSNRSRRLPSRPTTAVCTSTRVVRACGTTATRSRRCSASTATG